MQKKKENIKYIILLFQSHRADSLVITYKDAGVDIKKNKEESRQV